MKYRPDFSLRTLFVLVSLFCGWLGYELNWIRQRRDEFSSGRVIEDLYEISFGPSVSAPGLLWILGEKGHKTILGTLYHKGDYGTQMYLEEAESERLQRIFPEASILYDVKD